MKILLVHNFYQQRGGEDVVFESEANMLKERGHEVVQYSIHNDDIEGWGKKAAAGLFTVYNPFAKAKLAKKLREFRPDIVHVHNFFPQLSPSIFYACSEAGIPVVMTLHNFRILCPTAFLYHNELLRERSLKNSAFWTVMHRTYRSSLLGTLVVAGMVDFHKWIGTWNRKVDCFIALTAFARNKFIEGGISADRLLVKGNGLADPLRGAAIDAEVRRGGLYVGRLSQEKGIATLLSAWKDLDYPLRVAGDGPLTEMCEASQNKQITYLGRLNQQQVYAEMRRASFLILPSVWYEMFPMTLVEAFANGLPVLASRLGGLQSLLDDGVTGLAFEVGNPTDLRAKVRWAVDNADRMREMGTRARAVYEKSNTTETNYANLMNIYANVLQKVQPADEPVMAAE
jgi:glycosyltransferase involved in cell wall biosynthesis